MKYILVDEVNKPFFDEGDDIYDIVNNVYIETFYKAYTMYRDGTDGRLSKPRSDFKSDPTLVTAYQIAETLGMTAEQVKETLSVEAFAEWAVYLNSHFS
jgi:hypothetical protein